MQGDMGVKTCPKCGSDERVLVNVGIVRDTSDGHILTKEEREGTKYQSGCIVNDSVNGWVCMDCEATYSEDGEIIFNKTADFKNIKAAYYP